MKLSKFYTDVPDYLEYAYVCAPNAAGQAITANTITKLELNTEVQDLGGHGVLASNEVTLQPGVYYWEALGTFRTDVGSYNSVLVSLYNESLGVFVCRGVLQRVTLGSYMYGFQGTISGQITLSNAEVYSLKALGTAAIKVSSGIYTSELSTDATADADQRTTLKLWKLK